MSRERAHFNPSSNQSGFGLWSFAEEQRWVRGCWPMSPPPQSTSPTGDTSPSSPLGDTELMANISDGQSPLCHLGVLRHGSLSASPCPLVLHPHPCTILSRCCPSSVKATVPAASQVTNGSKALPSSCAYFKVKRTEIIWATGNLTQPPWVIQKDPPFSFTGRVWDMVALHIWPLWASSTSASFWERTTARAALKTSYVALNLLSSTRPTATQRLGPRFTGNGDTLFSICQEFLVG